jgi:tetratricopeptide (TPR) repeat protein
MALVWSGVAEAASIGEGRRCLEANDVPCAVEVVEALQAATSSDPDELAFAAETAFFSGRFGEAHQLIARAVEAGWEDHYDELGLYERTRDVTADWTEIDRGRFRIRYQPGIDAVLLDDAVRTLELSARNVEPFLGEPPPGRLDLEVYPDGRSFIAASSLTKQDVQTTGVVALSKWSRLLITSPRALGRGYTWQDTVAHEYIHLVVTYQTGDRAPVWLQEAIAKYLDNRWRTGREGFRLSVASQALLAEAIEKDEFVSFEMMHPSLAKLPSHEMAALAYAQLATLMAYAFDRGGDDVLLRALPMVKRGMDPRDALATAAGASSFEAMEEGWKHYVRGLDLVERKLQAMPTVLDGGDDIDTDPLLHDREDLARYVRLGDLLRERERYGAALVEYRKAIPTDEPRGPLLSNRIAQVHLALGELDLARQALEESLVDYPEFALTHKTLGAILRARGQKRLAVRSYERARELNPFDFEVQRALSQLYAELGDENAAARHMRYLRILRPNI